ncbi:hypothetical protein B0H34DRAFT_671502 [Crassisporium funariophilum]|nr:hypothetical protein B0H34DRAFT_671502 [Crassisporium funariophilum]
MSQYINHKEAAKSYRPAAGTMSPGLKRAREPYRVKNALVGLALGAFAVGVWAYSISAVKQDIFDDVDEEARAMGASGASVGGGLAVVTAGSVGAPFAPAGGVGVDEKATVETRAGAGKTEVGLGKPGKTTVGERVAEGRPGRKGVLQHLEQRYPRLLDPERKTLVWGAPPVDDLGKMWKS